MESIDNEPDEGAGTETVDVVVIGAGMAGLAAATELSRRGRDVVVVDKGRGVGGRLATRRIGPSAPVQGRADHGAQFFTARTERFRAFLAPLVAHGLVQEWTRGFGPTADGHARYAVAGGMTALAKHLAVEVAPHTSTRITAVDADGLVHAEDGRRWRGEHVVITAPAPQAVGLLGADAPDALGAIRYAPTLCLLGLLDRPFPSPGAWQRPTDTPFEFVSDNVAKGTSPVPVLTAHLTGEESERRWDDDDAATLAAMIDALDPLLAGRNLRDVELKRWRFATPTVLHPDPVLAAGRLVFAGDAFGSPRVEGAATSGWAAADLILGR